MSEKKHDLVIPKRRIDYRATLLVIPVGETKRLNASGRAYTGYTVAATRLRKEGIDIRIESDPDDNTILATRHS